MIVAGCDVGSLTAKAVIVKDQKIVGNAVIRAETRPDQSAKAVLDLALQSAKLAADDINYLVGTGYGRKQIPFVDGIESEIACHARGARQMMPDVRMVIDIGGQDAKATRIDENGNVVRYMYNDKCASGTGRFLEIMAETLEVPLAKMGEEGAKSTEKLTISNQCVIFAETEVISLINEGKNVCDIISALHTALAKRVAALAKSIEVKKEVVMTGGVAKNSGVFQAIGNALNVSMKQIKSCDPQIVGAFGAALFAQEKYLATHKAVSEGGVKI